MTTTPGLIARLSSHPAPVRRAWHPAGRAATWLGMSAAVIGGLALLHGPRPDLAARLQEENFCLGCAACVATGARAALAAFLLSLPDRSRLWLLLPMPAAALWLASVGYGCLSHWVPLGDAAIDPAEAWRCLTTLVLAWVPLSAALFWMLRRSARLRPQGAVLAASMAAAAATASAMTLIHAFDASAMILAWTAGAAALVLAADAAIGRAVLRPGRTQAGISTAS